MKLLCISLGCDKNLVDAERMLGSLSQDGYTFTDDEQEADVILVNTCCFINDAKEESVNTILEMAEYKKSGTCKALLVSGCMAQRYKEEILQEVPEVDGILGTTSYDEVSKVLAEALKGERVSDFHDLSELPETKMRSKRLVTTGGHYAFLKISEGCNKRCTYCIIPYARGRVRSRRQSDVVEEVKRLAEAGYQEVVLTGIHLSSYGLDFPEGEKETLLDLIRAVDAVDGIRRIRLGSLEPGIITEEFAEAIAAMPKVCPHFHLSLQSGSNGTLKRMNRKYTAEEYKHKCDLLRKVYGNPALTTDVIVGFPQESEEEFEESRAFVEDIHFFETHIFKYSRREGTRAAAMAGQIPEQEKTKRSHVLLELDERRRQEYMEGFLGKELEVLMEEEVEIDGVHYWTGHTREYLRVAVLSEENLMNQMVLVTPARIHGKDCLM